MRKRCPSGKTKFGDYDTALAVAKRDSEKAHAAIIPYRCTICLWWHVGHKVSRLVRENTIRPTR